MQNSARKIKQEEPLQMTIDRFGRIVIPQEVREALHLRPGTKLAVVKQTDREIFLQVVEEEPELKWMNGVLVICGKGKKLDYDIVKAIKEDREERTRHIWGFDK